MNNADLLYLLVENKQKLKPSTLEIFINNPKSFSFTANYSEIKIIFKSFEFMFGDNFFEADLLDDRILYIRDKDFINKFFIKINKSSVITISYHEQLKTKEWEQRRKEIIELAGNKCNRCSGTEILQVHHKKYRKGKLAWEYPDEDLECLCRKCHKKHHEEEVEEKKKAEETIWLKRVSISLEESKNMCKYKNLILRHFNNEVVNNIVNTFELKSYDNRSMWFKTDDIRYYNYLSKLFGKAVMERFNAIGFNLNIMYKKK